MKSPIIETDTLSDEELKEKIKKIKKLMNDAAINMNFIEATQHRDKMFLLEKKLQERKKK